ncbi:hypothetical protein [Weissella minor]|uniref:hypothetical protein n=1 Tax=Weissella minor TaxID=1620 RepID=UPI003AF276DA
MHKKILVGLVAGVLLLGAAGGTYEHVHSQNVKAAKEKSSSIARSQSASSRSASEQKARAKANAESESKKKAKKEAAQRSEANYETPVPENTTKEQPASPNATEQDQQTSNNAGSAQSDLAGYMATHDKTPAAQEYENGASKEQALEDTYSKDPSLMTTGEMQAMLQEQQNNNE